jgi:hypothetical protein
MGQVAVQLRRRRQRPEPLWKGLRRDEDPVLARRIGLRVLVALMSAGTQNWAGRGSDHDPDRLTQADAALALACVGSRWAQEAVRVVILDDWTRSDELESWLYGQAAEWAQREGWRLPRGEQVVRRMACMALIEWRYPKLWATERDKADSLGRSRAQWFAVWRPRYERIYRLLGQLLGQAAADIGRVRVG